MFLSLFSYQLLSKDGQVEHPERGLSLLVVVFGRCTFLNLFDSYMGIFKLPPPLVKDKAVLSNHARSHPSHCFCLSLTTI